MELQVVSAPYPGAKRAKDVRAAHVGLRPGRATTAGTRRLMQHGRADQVQADVALAHTHCRAVGAATHPATRYARRH